MLKQFNEKFWASLVKKRGALVVSSEAQREIIESSKKVRSCDYVVNFEVKNGAANMQNVVTRANWLFILTNAAVYWDSFNVADFPKISVKFPYYTPDSPFNTPAKDIGCVPSNLVFGREGLNGKMQHFEEYKNLYYLLNQRFVITLDAICKIGQYGRGAVLLSGLEIDLNEV